MSEEDLRNHIVERGIAVPEGGGQYTQLFIRRSHGAFAIDMWFHLARTQLTCASFAVVTDNDGQALSEKDSLIVAIRAAVSSEYSFSVASRSPVALVQTGSFKDWLWWMCTPACHQSGSCARHSCFLGRRALVTDAIVG